MKGNSMHTLTWPGQKHRDHILDQDDTFLLTGWRLGCPKCGDMIVATPSQSVRNVEDHRSHGCDYVQLSTVCLHCGHPTTELWLVN